MAIDIGAVMDAVGTRLRTISGLRVMDYPADTVAPPAAVVGLPDEVTFDTSFARFSDMAVVPVTLVVGRVSDRASRDALSAYLAGTGPRSIKTVFDSDQTLGGVAKTSRCASATVSSFPVAGVDYLGATFRLEVWQ